jgi:hypothetical protein
MTIASKIGKTEDELVGKTLYVELKDRAETEWSGVKCVGVSERLISIEYETRGVLRQDFLPWNNISYISVRYSNSNEAAVAPTT